MKYEDPIIVEEKIKLIDYRIIATILFMMSTTLSIILLYNQKLDILNQKTLFSEKEGKTINVINSAIVLLIILFIQYLNYKTKEINEFERKFIAPINMNITSSYLLIIASIISLYSAYINPTDEEENIQLI